MTANQGSTATPTRPIRQTAESKLTPTRAEIIAALEALLDRARAGITTGMIAMEFDADGGGRVLIQGSATEDRWRTKGAVMELAEAVCQAAEPTHGGGA